MHAKQHSVNSSWTHGVMAYKAGGTIYTMGHPVCCKLDRLTSNMLAGLQLRVQQPRHYTRALKAAQRMHL